MRMVYGRHAIRIGSLEKAFAMPAALYSDYIDDLRGLFEEIDNSPDNFRTFDVHIELAHKGMLFVYEIRKKKGQTDSIYYARMASTGASKQISQKTAYDAVVAFMRHGQFIALTGEQSEMAEFPSCAAAISYRKTGMPDTRSMKMIFLGFAGDDEAAALGSQFDAVATRPYRSSRVWEWQ